MAKKGSGTAPAATRIYGVIDAKGNERLIEATSNVQAVMHVYGPKVRLVPGVEGVKRSRAGENIEDATADTSQQALPIDPPANGEAGQGAQNAAGPADPPKGDDGSAPPEKSSQAANPAADATPKAAAPKTGVAGKGK